MFLPINETLFVAGTYDLLENLGEILEQFHRFAAQYWILSAVIISPSRLMPESKRTPPRKAEKSRALAAHLPDKLAIRAKLSMGEELIQFHGRCHISSNLRSFDTEPVTAEALSFLPKSPGKGIARCNGLSMAQKILIVEDNSDLSQLLAFYLSDAGYETSVAGNLAQGISKA